MKLVVDANTVFRSLLSSDGNSWRPLVQLMAQYWLLPSHRRPMDPLQPTMPNCLLGLRCNTEVQATGDATTNPISSPYLRKRLLGSWLVWNTR